MSTVWMLCMVLCAGTGDWQARMDAAQKDYDVTAAQAVADELRKEAGPQATPEMRLLFLKSLLLTVEQIRVQYETMQQDGADRGDRRVLADKMDALAEEGLKVADGLGEVSEAYRIRADFYALKIRSKYQGKKYRNKMENSAEKALQLDPKNAFAYVSVARPYLFAGPLQGGDVKKAMGLLDKALALDPNLLSARMMRAVGYAKQDDKARCEAEWAKIVAENPKTAQSKKTMEIAGKVWEEGDGPSE